MAYGCQSCFFIMIAVVRVWMEGIASEDECPCNDAPKITHNTSVLGTSKERDPSQKTKTRTHLQETLLSCYPPSLHWLATAGQSLILPCFEIVLFLFFFPGSHNKKQSWLEDIYNLQSLSL